MTAEAGRSSGVVAVRPGSKTVSRQEHELFEGISGATAGATGISMHLIVIPPGGSAQPHLHQGFESAIYVLKGRVETRYGPGLRESVISEAGDFLYIASGVPHQPVNLSQTEEAMGIVARNDPDEQESVVPYQVTSE